MKTVHDLIVDEAGEGVRLDVHLSRCLGITRSEAARLIDQGDAVVDGRPRKPSFRLAAGMAVHAVVEGKGDGAPLMGVDLPLAVLYEDSDIVVIDKQPGLVVHPGAGSTGPTLVHALIHRYPGIDSVGPSDRPGIVHRLDRLTSGVMVVARSVDAYLKLSAAFKAHEHERVYKAVCYGRLGQETGRIETLMHRNPGDRKKMSSRVTEGRVAITNWRVLREWEQLSLLELCLETGRTHQIRVHLSDLGHPVVGDPEYGGRNRANVISDPVVRARIRSLRRQMLHAWRLRISHPVTGEPMEFTSDLPGDFQDLINLLDERQGHGAP